MQFRRIGQLVAATTVSAVALSGAQAVAQENKTTISVTNITDIHGHLEDKIGDPAKSGDEIGVARLQTLIKQVNEDQEFNLTSSGDNVGGSCQMRVFGTGVLGTRYCRVPGSWYRAEGCVGPDR